MIARVAVLGSMSRDFHFTAASDSEDLMGELCSSLPPSKQEKHTSLSYSELLDMITSDVGKLGLELDS